MRIRDLKRRVDDLVRAGKGGLEVRATYRGQDKGELDFILIHEYRDNSKIDYYLIEATERL